MGKRGAAFAGAVLAGLWTLGAAAQPPGGPPPGGPDGGPPGRPPGNQPGDRGRTQQRQRNPLFEALDLNHDGVLSAEEIQSAPESLRKLDKNGDGKLTQNEIRPSAPGETRNPRADRPKGKGREERPERGRDGDGRGSRPPGGETAEGGPRGEGGPQGAGPGGVRHVLPPFAVDGLNLTAEQLSKIHELDETVTAKLKTILTAEQQKKLAEMRPANSPAGGGGERGESADRSSPPGGRGRIGGSPERPAREGDEDRPPRRPPPGDSPRPERE